jgi:hypothetical protein
VKPGCHISVTEDGVSVTTTTLVGTGLDIEAIEDNPCDKITVVPGCHIQVNEDGVGVTPTTLIGDGLTIQASGGGCDKIKVDAGCGITVDTNGVSLDLDSIAGAGLQSNGAMPCPALEIDVLDDEGYCSHLMFVGGKLAVDPASLAGPGLGVYTSGDCDSLKVNVGCGLEISEGGDTVRVKNTDLAGTGLEAGTGCKLQVDAKYIQGLIDERLDSLQVQLAIRDCKLTVETTLPNGTVNASDSVDICCIVQQCIEPVEGAVCEAGYYCTKDGTGAYSCQELACGDTAPEGSTIESGPWASAIECADHCGFKWFCIEGDPNNICRKVPYGWYSLSDGTATEYTASTVDPFPTGTEVNDGPFGTAAEAWADAAIGVPGDGAMITADGPFDTEEECEASGCEGEMADPPCTTCDHLTPATLKMKVSNGTGALSYFATPVTYDVPYVAARNRWVLNVYQDDFATNVPNGPYVVGDGAIGLQIEAECDEAGIGFANSVSGGFSILAGHPGGTFPGNWSLTSGEAGRQSCDDNGLVCFQTSVVSSSGAGNSGTVLVTYCRDGADPSACDA